MAAPPLSPDPAHAAVLSHRDGALLVVGGSGTGKTAVLLERFARLLEDGAEPDRTVLVAGSRRARDAARAAMLERVAISSSGPQIVTGHGLAHRILKEREGEAPEVLGAAEQFAKVQELLAAQDPAEWPAYGRLRGLRGFADQVRQLLARMQESLWTPDRIDEAADRAGLHGWHELARFAREYQDALDMVNQVDYAGLLQRVAASEGPPLFDHVLVDDYQDTTFAFEAVLRGLGAADIVVAADPDAHVFSFQGATDEPAARFATEAFPGTATVELTTPHRAPEPIEISAWVTPVSYTHLTLPTILLV